MKIYAQSVQLVKGREADPGLGLSQQEINLARISAVSQQVVCIMCHILVLINLICLYLQARAKPVVTRLCVISS